MRLYQETSAGEDWNITFSQNVDRTRWFMQRIRTDVAPRIDAQRPVRVLDLGCGCGAGSFLLSEMFPQARIIGLDISEANIEAARRELAARLTDRVSFVCGDYSQVRFPSGHFDLIVSDSVLHLIPNAAGVVMPKLAGELAGGGCVVFSMPHDGLFNRLLWLVRFMLRLFRSSITDSLILQVARALHAGNTQDAFLHERINYMYVTPSLWFSRKLRSELSGLGLVNVRDCGYPNSSPGQFQHRLCIYSKPPPAAAARSTRAA